MGQGRKGDGSGKGGSYYPDGDGGGRITDAYSIVIRQARRKWKGGHP